MTSCDTAVNTWTLPRESNEWVGPIVVTKTDEGTGEPVSDPVLFVVVAKGARPVAPSSNRSTQASWTALGWAVPVTDPDGGTDIGVTAAAVAGPGSWGIWAVVVGSSEQPVLEPRQVGWIERT